MKKLFLFFLFSTSLHFGQNITKEILVGTWKVKEVLPSKMSKNHKMKDILDGFSNATFTFYDDTNFKFSTTKTSKTFSMMLDMFVNTKWKLTLDKNQIKIGTQKDNYSIMVINIGTIENKIVFFIAESELYLIVKKQ